MHVKKNDTVAVIRGDDKGKTGKVLAVFPREGLVLVEGVNVRKRHLKPTRAGAPGSIVERAMPIRAEKVRVADAPKAAKKKPAAK